MARKKSSGGGGPGAGDWLNTYADMVTLLLTFFILLYSMSTMDAAKFNMLVAAFASDKDSSSKIIIKGEGEGNAQTGSTTGPEFAEGAANTEIQDLQDIFQYLKDYVEKESLAESINVEQTADGTIYIRFMNDMLFEPNSARLKPADLEILDFIGYGIKSVQGSAEMIAIHGHTAAVPDNPDYQVSDRTLSSNRANTVLMYFEDTIGIDSQKLYSVGWGKNMPIAPNDTEENRAKNRRVEILISGDNLLRDQLDNIYEKLVE